VIFHIDLPSQTVKVGESSYKFEIAQHHKQNMIKGLDAIGQTLDFDQSISAFEEKRAAWL